MGSLPPDFAYLIAGRPHRTIGHELNSIFMLDLTLSLLTLVEMSLATPGLATLLPGRFAEPRRRLEAWRVPWRSPGQVVRLLLAILVGASSHIVIDSFTHAGDWGTRYIPRLNTRIGAGNITVAYLFQLSLSAAGAAALALVFSRWFDDVGHQPCFLAIGWSRSQIAAVVLGFAIVVIGTVGNQVDQLGGTLSGNLVIAFLGLWRATALAALVVGLILRLTRQPSLVPALAETDLR